MARRRRKKEDTIVSKWNREDEVCPYCDSRDLYWVGHFDVMTDTWRCNECESEWNVVTRVEGVYDIQTGKKL